MVIRGATPAAADGPFTATFNVTGAVQQWTVPLFVTSVTVDVQGASGGAPSASAKGKGGRVQASVAVTPLQTLYVYVGGQASGGAGGYNGGADAGSGPSRYGGGGASDIRVGGQGLSNRVVVAGGGGGAAWLSAPAPHGGHGGGLVGGDGVGGADGSCQAL